MKISWENVARFLYYDPFTTIPKEQATVGALRALATDVETGAVPREKWRARYEAHPHYKIQRPSGARAPADRAAQPVSPLPGRTAGDLHPQGRWSGADHSTEPRHVPGLTGLKLRGDTIEWCTDRWRASASSRWRSTPSSRPPGPSSAEWGAEVIKVEHAGDG